MINDELAAPVMPDTQLLRRFPDFHFMSEEAKHLLLDSAQFYQYAPGDIIFKARKGQRETNSYLVSGSVELRRSFENRDQCDAQDKINKRSLNDLLGDSGHVKAIESCEVLVVNLNDIESLATVETSYVVEEFSTVNSLATMEQVNQEFRLDWQLAFLKEPLAQHIPPQAIKDLFSGLTMKKFAAGEVIMKSRTQGDYFYLIQQGAVSVVTEADGAFAGREFVLRPGQCFGDEALIADTVRNATVSMKTDGVLGRLDKNLFTQLIKRYLVRGIRGEGVASNPFGNTTVIDIRLGFERQAMPAPQARHIPIDRLRKSLAALSKTGTYLVMPAGDVRSELATYLLRQGGLDAYMME